MSTQPHNQFGPPTGSPAEPLTPLAELHLVEEHRRGDPQAAKTLLQSYERRLYTVCFRMVHNEPDARDLTQDSMLKILQGLDSYDGRSKLSTWIIRVTMNCCLSHLRKQRLRRHRSLDSGAQGQWEAPAGPPEIPGGVELSPQRHVEQSEMRLLLSRALAGLDPQMRAVLVLRDMQELEYHRIARILDVPVGTVKSRLFRARVALRAAVEMETQRPRPDE